jgi:phage terminase small subunit
MLTDKQERFAQCIALEGMNQSDAYRECFDTENYKPESIWVEASKLANSPNVVQRIKELKDKVVSPKIMSAKERREKLTELAQGEDANVVMKAIDLLNKMDGEYVQKIEATVDQVSINVELVDE